MLRGDMPTSRTCVMVCFSRAWGRLTCSVGAHRADLLVTMTTGSPFCATRPALQWSSHAPAMPHPPRQCAPAGRTVPRTTRRGRQRDASWCTRHRVTLCAPAPTSRILRPLGRALGVARRMCWVQWTSSALKSSWRTSRYVQGHRIKWVTCS